eukprot:TRINITY_DN7047_c0_g1_i1.p1 TRINITY_DN7047_c0_g1~~TRINITY_DN7047_c0_g1_i1.p1  ORF type:complete len:739 (+),score=205.31 TRINITY_DN7047_c0_g1_i1:17-2233(+)
MFSNVEDVLNSAYDDLVDFVEPLVDVLSQLVLDSVAEDLVALQDHIHVLAANTTSLVETAKNAALKEDDNSMIEDVTGAISGLSSSIEGLITALVKLFEVRGGDPSVSELFSNAITKVGDAIKNLVEVSDETSRHRMSQLIRVAIMKLREMYDNYHTKSPGQLERDKSEYSDLNNKLKSVASKAERVSQNPEQKNLYRSSCVVLDNMTDDFCNKLIAVANGTSSFGDVQPLFDKLNDAYKTIVSALKLNIDNPWDKITNTAEYVRKIIAAAKEMQKASKALKDSIERGDGKIDENLELTLNAVRNLISVTKEALANEEDPIKRQFLLKQIEDAANYAKMFQQAAEQAKSGNPEGVRLAKVAYNNLANTAQRIVLGAKIPKQGYASEDYPIHIATTALESVGGYLMNAAERGDKDAVIENARKTAQVAQETANTLISLAESLLDSSDKAQLQNLANGLQAQAVQLIRDAKEVYQNPTPENIARMQASYQALQEMIREARQYESTPPGFVDATYTAENQQEDSNEYQDFQMDLMFTDEDPELVKAAKAEALAAIEIFNEAEKLVSSDPALMSQLEPLGLELQRANRAMVEAAKLAAANPNNVEYQAQFNRAQKELNSIIEQIVSLTAPTIDVTSEFEELESIHRDFKPEVGAQPETIAETLMIAETVMDNLDRLMEGLFSNMSPEDMINNTAEVTNQVREVAKHLRTMASQTDNPAVKEVLTNGASFYSNIFTNFKYHSR